MNRAKDWLPQVAFLLGAPLMGVMAGYYVSALGFPLFAAAVIGALAIVGGVFFLVDISMKETP